MKYDIASKVLLEHCKSSVLRHFCGLDVEESEIIEDAPQETATLRRADYVLRARIAGLGTCLVVMELVHPAHEYLSAIRDLKVDINRDKIFEPNQIKGGLCYVHIFIVPYFWAQGYSL